MTATFSKKSQKSILNVSFKRLHFCMEVKKRYKKFFLNEYIFMLLKSCKNWKKEEIDFFQRKDFHSVFFHEKELVMFFSACHLELHAKLQSLKARSLLIGQF